MTKISDLRDMNDLRTLTEVQRQICAKAVWIEYDFDLSQEYGVEVIMNAEDLDCLKRAGRDAGAYVVALGKTDLKDFTREEWLEFTGKLVMGYEKYKIGCLAKVTG